MLLVTGGAGFIGGNFVHHWRARSSEPLVVLDKLTYAGNAATIAGLCELVHGDIADAALVERLFAEHRPRAVLNFAAETHVDRSIREPGAFVQTNVVGSFVLLEAARRHWAALPAAERDAFRFLQVSTDEVYGSLEPGAPAFDEDTPYAPNSPYSASKAGADHFVRAYHRTYGLPTLTTHCSNNYGPYQFPEKLIPLVILNALEGKPLPIYGDGLHVRDWLHVQDHCDALVQVLERGRPGEGYPIGGGTQVSNLDVVRGICRELDALRPAAEPRERLITFVADRPGHDRRYAIDGTKTEGELGWRARASFESGIAQTVRWYLDNPGWTEAVRSGAYRDWLRTHYAP